MVGRRGGKLPAAAVLVAATVAGCTTASSAAHPTSASGSTAAGAHRVDTDRMARQLDIFFADDAASLNAFRDRQALLIMVDGRPVLERYSQSSATTTAPLSSITKTIMSTLIGIALDEGALKGLDHTLAELLPSYTAVMSPQVRKITLRQLLTMTSGLPGDDSSSPQTSRPGSDWIRDILVRGVDGPPGHFRFSSANSRLLSAILSQATGRSTLAYAREKLFDPLGIATRPADELVAVPENVDEFERAGFAWLTDPQHRNTGDDGVKLTARDLAKIGQLWLQDGRWENHQLVSARWIRSAQTDTVGTNDHTAVEYGYQVWLRNSDGYHAILARGPNQLLEIVPDRGLVVVALSRHDQRRPDPGVADDQDYVSLVTAVIAPAVH
jgi:CubicO group peptidase (beta-lactamase class C family)